MGIERLTRKIIEEAEKERERIKRDYEEKIAALEREIEEERERLRREGREKIKREMEGIRRKEVAEKRLKEQSRILMEQWALIRKVLAEVKKEFRTKVINYPELLRKIIERFASPGDTITFASDDLPLFQNQFPELKKENSNHLSAGVVIKKEKEEIDFSLESTLEAMKEEIILGFKEVLEVE
jgi:vacuolar-type H+-ATPase subunit E/Vma4